MKRLCILLTLLLLSAYSVAAGELKPDLAKKLAETRAIDDVPVIIIFNEKPTYAQVDDVKAEGASIKHQYKIINAVAAKASPKAVERIAGKQHVKTVELDYDVKAVLDSSAKQITADQVWLEGMTGKNVDVAILDTGIDDSHPAILQVSKAADFTGEGKTDLNGHGTHVAGIVASQDQTYRGIAHDSRLMNVKVLNKNGEGTASAVMQGIEWAVYNGAEIISMSFGAQLDTCDGTDAVSQTIDKAAASGALAVIAAGNAGPNAGTITVPACAKKGLAVGAVDDSSAAAYFSSRGPTTDGRTKPDIVTPGVGITSTYKDSTFKSLSGTSMSTPHISGVAALLLEAKLGQSPDDLISAIKSTARDLGLDSNTQGSGLANAHAAYSLVANVTQDTASNQTNKTTEEPRPEKLPPGIAKRTELPPGLQKKAAQSAQSEFLRNMLNRLLGLISQPGEDEETALEAEAEPQEPEEPEQEKQPKEAKAEAKKEQKDEAAPARRAAQESQQPRSSMPQVAQPSSPAQLQAGAEATAPAASIASPESSKSQGSQGNRGGSSDSAPGQSAGPSPGSSGGNSNAARGNQAITGNAVFRFFSHNLNQLKNFINQLTNKNQ